MDFRAKKPWAILGVKAMKWEWALTWMMSSWDMPVCASRQLETIFSGKRECWGQKEPGVRTEDPGGGWGVRAPRPPCYAHSLECS